MTGLRSTAQLVELTEEERARSTQAIQQDRAAAVKEKMTALIQAEAALVAAKIAKDVIDDLKRCAAAKYNEEKAELPLGDPDEDERELLDDIEITLSGTAACQQAIEIGISDRATLMLIEDFGMRVADFCFASDVESLDI